MPVTVTLPAIPLIAASENATGCHDAYPGHFGQRVGERRREALVGRGLGGFDDEISRERIVDGAVDRRLRSRCDD